MSLLGRTSWALGLTGAELAVGVVGAELAGAELAVVAPNRLRSSVEANVGRGR
jgi:hypothetical protein